MIGHEVEAKIRTQDIEIDEDFGFESFLLSERVLKGLLSNGFIRPSPIQLQAIPFGRVGLDLIVQAKSGTGKTCVFTVVALESIIEDSRAAQVLILAPTREIAVQIAQTVETIGCNIKGLKVGVFIGGLSVKKDEASIGKCQVVVGTPGRLRQLIELKLLNCSSIRLFVIDEADKLLEKSFLSDINWIYSSLPVNKQMIATSATYPEELAQLLTQYMRNPQFIRMCSNAPALLGISQYVRLLHEDSKAELKQKLMEIVHLLSTVPFNQCILFCNYQTRAETFHNLLNTEGWPCVFISGSQDQSARLQVLSKLRLFSCRILVSTDLTARGIDAENVNLVVNVDVPRDVATYLHRIGRAGRYGSIATAVTFASSRAEREILGRIMKASNSVVKILPSKFKLEDLSCELPVYHVRPIKKQAGGRSSLKSESVTLQQQECRRICTKSASAQETDGNVNNLPLPRAELKVSTSNTRQPAGVGLEGLAEALAEVEPSCPSLSNSITPKLLASLRNTLQITQNEFEEKLANIVHRLQQVDVENCEDRREYALRLFSAGQQVQDSPQCQISQAPPARDVNLKTDGFSATRDSPVLTKKSLADVITRHEVTVTSTGTQTHPVDETHAEITQDISYVDPAPSEWLAWVRDRLKEVSVIKNQVFQQEYHSLLNGQKSLW